MLPRLAVAAALVLGLAGCSGDGPAEPAPTPTSATPATAEPSGTIALLMPGPPAMRSEAFDRRSFSEAVAERCPDCRVVSYDARGDAARQSEQLAGATDAGARVLVIDAVEPLTVVNQLSAAQELGVKVVGYDTLLEDLDYYVAYDREQAGEQQAHALLKAAGGSGDLVMLNGSPADAGAVQVKGAAHQVLDASRATVVGEYDALPDRPKATHTWLSTILTFFPPSTLAGLYAADDALAGTAIHALGGADLPVTGAGATLAGVRRLVSGRQLMTVYRPVDPAATTTARIAVAALTGGDPGQPTRTLDGVPTYLLDPVPVTLENLADTVVADGYWTVEEICTRRLRAACDDAGLR
ncbi:substrate-binding domain-containing protein [Nocardioides sp. URHA0032]|uniref:substrate-binding domain-containing protein n=1 Tax=Nocardioides sp. URHA0032 TaxID=1380388 RepID=UPI000685AEC5|nr:substrate-binding domain-containing protein [Nocardioides sp. URHA0032]